MAAALGVAPGTGQATTHSTPCLEKLSRPSFTLEMNQAEWSFKQAQWTNYISQTLVKEELKVQQLQQCCQMGRLYTTMVVYTTFWPKRSYFGRLFILKVVFHLKLVVFWSPFHSLYFNVDMFFS